MPVSQREQDSRSGSHNSLTRTLPTTYHRPERPFLFHPCTNHISGGAYCEHPEGEGQGLSLRRHEYIDPTATGDESGQGIEPHTEGPREAGSPQPQKEKADGLGQVLDEHSGGNQAPDDLIQFSQAEDGSHYAESDERYVGELPFRMKPRKDAEEVAVGRRSVRNARVTEQQRENGRECNPQQEHGHKMARSRTMQPFDVLRRNELALRCLLPGKYAQESSTHQNEQRTDRDNGKYDGTRDNASRVANLLG